VALADFKGKLVLINLWATWCQPCLKEMPSLEKLQAAQADKLTVAAISEDRGGNQVVEPFVAKLGLDKVMVYLDPKSAVGHAFSVRGLPTTLVIDTEGRLVGRVEGAAEWDSEKNGRRLAAFPAEHRSRCQTQAGRPLRTSRRKTPPRCSPSGSIECSTPTQARVSTGTPGALERGFGMLQRVERHHRVVGAVHQQHRRAASATRWSAARARSAGRNSRECRRAASRDAAVPT